MKKVFIEIGSCDFDNLDNLLNEGWQGYFIEPIPDYYYSLKNKILNPNAYFHNIAISSSIGYKEMTYVDSLTVKEQWMRGISHLSQESSNLINRNVELGYNLGNIKRVKVPSVTLDFYLSLFDIKQIDMLRIDTEGHELAILSNYSWSVKPKKIKVEHKFVDKDKLLDILTDNDYTVADIGDDFYCVYNEVNNE